MKKKKLKKILKIREGEIIKLIKKVLELDFSIKVLEDDLDQLVADKIITGLNNEK